MSVLKQMAFVLISFWATLSFADGNYADHPLARALVDELVLEEGFERAYLQQLFAEAQRKDSILEAISRPAEKTKAWYEYRQIFVTDKREQQGIEFYHKHRKTLERAQRELGVPAEIIVAIIGVETYYGRLTGNYRVIDSLATLAFDYPRRASFFSKELKNFLILTREQAMDPLMLKGSYAGAMGFGQFMPSSYRSYAIDFDGDGLIDIWNNPVDAIGSVANYFKRHGWRSDEPVVFEAIVGENSPGLSEPESWFNNGLKPVRSLEDYAAASIISSNSPDPAALATAMKFELEEGYEYWLGMHNFYVITRYNHSAMYAMCVYQLSQLLTPTGIE